jgi:hypothetical protein
MTPKQADLIRYSFDAIWSVRPKVAELFYRRFFELAPDAQRLFPSDNAVRTEMIRSGKHAA